MKKIILIAAAALIVAGAAGAFFFFRKSLIPDVDTMSRIMADTYIVDAVGQARGDLYKDSPDNTYMTESYHAVLSRYGIDKQLYDSAQQWYSTHPELYTEVYEKVVNILSQREAVFTQLIKQRDSVKTAIATDQTILNKQLWNRLLAIIRTPLDEYSLCPKNFLFDFKLDSVNYGKLRFKMDYYFLDNDEKFNDLTTQMRVHYGKVATDTITFYLANTRNTQKVTYNYNLRDTIGATRVELELIHGKNREKLKSVFSNIDLYFEPYIITDSVKYEEILLPPLFSY